MRKDWESHEERACACDKIMELMQKNKLYCGSI